MEHLHFQPGLPPELLAALQTMSDGGMLYAVAQATLPSSTEKPLMPCFVVRSPATPSQLETARLALTTRLVAYEAEGPLAIFHLTIYDRPPERQAVTVHGRLVGVRIQPINPFELECFLNPTVDEDRLMLQVLASSPVFTIVFYGTDPAMTSMAIKRYRLPVEQQQAARQILEETTSMTSSPERFLSAQQRFLQENPLY